MCVWCVYPQNVELHITFAGEHSTGMPPEVMQPRLDHGDLSPPSLFYLQLDVPPGNVLVPQSYLGNIRYSRYSLMSLQARGAPVHIHPNTHTHTHTHTGKKDPRALERHLPKALRFASFHLLHHRRILVHSDLGSSYIADILQTALVIS